MSHDITKLSTDEINAKIKDIFVSNFEVDENDLYPEQSLYEGLGLDSLDAIDLVINFQNHFGVKPTEDELRELKTVADVFSLADKYRTNA